MKILVTGANGLLGQKLIQLYIQKGGHQLYATGRGANRLPITEGYTYVAMDCTDEQAVDTVMDQIQPEVIIHTAAMTNVDQCEREPENCQLQNVDAVAYLVQAAERYQAFFLHISTDFIFDGESGPYSEKDKANPVSIYGESKLKSEEIVKNSNLKWAIARTVLVYGIAHDMSRSNIILWVKGSLESGKPIQVVDDQWRTPTLAEDLAMGCYLIAEQQVEGVFNISGKDFLTPYEMAMMTADYFDLDKFLITKTDGSKFKQDAKRPPRTGFKLDKAERVLGYNPHSFTEGIAVLAKQLGSKA